VLIPLRHENMRGRRWPYISFALIALNIVIFLLTWGPIQEQQPKRAQVQLRLLVLAARHPELQLSPEANVYVESVKKRLGENWDRLATATKADLAQTGIDLPPAEADSASDLQQQMDGACQAFEAERSSNILANYGYVPAEPRAISYITANFLHGGWMHLIGNMWFLWLAGFILEDHWGRLIYPAFYLIAGAAALQFYGWCALGSFMPLIGASGAVAALMGAFLVRFPKMKIEMGCFVFYYFYRFKAPAYALLPLWVLAEFFYGSVYGVSSPVAHWAHVGGFLFGMAGAYGLRRSGLEQQAFDTIEEKIGWAADPEILRATEAQEKSNFDEAAAILVDYVKHKPTTDALDMLQQIQWRRNDMPGYLQATAQLLQVHLKAQNPEAALRDFDAYTNAGGDQLAAPVWLEMARMLENQQHFDRAAEEYQRLADRHCTEKQSVLALVAAGRLYLKRLNRPADSLKCYEKADVSTVPHLDWQPNIEGGLADSKAAIAQAAKLTYR
jgi:membrane associated rhomboid family serine protease